MDWNAYTIFGLASGASLIVCAGFTFLDLRQRFVLPVFGIGLIVYSIYAGTATSGVFVFPVAIFIIPFVVVAAALAESRITHHARTTPSPDLNIALNIPSFGVATNGDRTVADNAAREILNLATDRLQRYGPPAAYLRATRLVGHQAYIIGHRLTSVEFDQWMTTWAAEHEGIAAFSCVHFGGVSDSVIAQAVDTSNGVRIRYSMPVRKISLGRYRLAADTPDFVLTA